MKKTADNKNFIWNMIGLSAYTLVSFILLIVVKLVNGTSTAGVFTYSFSLCTLFLYISLYYNRTYQLANSKFSFNQFFSARIITSIVSLILILIFSLFSNFDINKILIILSLMLFRTIDAISECFYGFLQSKGKLYTVGISYTLKSIFGILIFAVCDLLTNNIILSIILLDLINVLFFFIYDIKNYISVKDEKLFFVNTGYKNIFISSLPVFIFSFLSVYLANSQKYVITYFSSDDLQAIFGILIMPATVISLIGTYLIQPFLNKFILFLKEKKISDFNKLTFKINFILGIVGVAILIVSYFIGVPILNIIYQVDLNKYKFDLLIIIVGSLFIAMGMIFSGILTVLNNNKGQILLYYISSIVSTLACYILAKNNIIRGASISYLISSLSLIIGFIILYFYTINKKKKY